MKGEKAVLRYSVKDTGIGIKDEDLGKLFAQFERIEESRNRHIEGTGLGMNIAMQLLVLMGSDLKVQSEYGKGSEFYFDITQDIINSEPLGDFNERIHQAAKEYNYAVTYSAPNARILVVDDNEINRKVVRGLLKQTQIKISEAGSGKDCIDMVKQQSFDLIFLDCMMPVMDGVETFRILKDKNLCGSTPVIMLTANAVVGAKEQYLKEGFSDYLTKPIIPDKLDKMILKHLPEELIVKGDYIRKEKESASNDNLPQLEEFDFDYAMILLKSREVLEKTLLDFYNMLGNLPGKLEGLYDAIEQEDALDLYRIEVHALKSTAAMVGAILLSKVARMLEVSATDKDIRRIKALHPILLEEMEKHRQRIATILPQSEDKAVVENAEEVCAYFDMLKMSLESSDYNTADFIWGEIWKYKYPDQIQVLVNELAGQVMNLQTDAAILTIDKIKRGW